MLKVSSNNNTFLADSLGVLVGLSLFLSLSIWPSCSRAINRLHIIFFFRDSALLCVRSRDWLFCGLPFQTCHLISVMRIKSLISRLLKAFSPNFTFIPNFLFPLKSQSLLTSAAKLVCFFTSFVCLFLYLRRWKWRNLKHIICCAREVQECYLPYKWVPAKR